MTIKDKIDAINAEPVQPLENGDNDTIEGFFEQFIKPRLPKPCVIKQWHRLLMDYTDVSNLENLSCCVRYGNRGSKELSQQGESGYYKLRRGWLTRNTADNFEYFYADNFFSSFIYKMALDEYYPPIGELKEAFQKHYFPYGFGFKIDKKINEYKGVVIATAKQPGFLGIYKLSHVFDSGENFFVNGRTYKDTELSRLYYDIGHSDDYLKNPDKIRKMKIDDMAKKVIIAKFLRFAHPFNYFLTPAKKLHCCKVKVYKNDIGEDPRMISYVKSYLQKEYPVEYKEFLDRIMWDNSADQTKEDGSTYIGISYGTGILASLRGKSSGTSKAAITAVKPTVATAGPKIGEYAKGVFENLLSGGKLKTELLINLMDKKYCSDNFAISYPVFVLNSSVAYDPHRYYKDVVEGKYLVCSQWYERSRNKIAEWLIQNSF